MFRSLESFEQDPEFVEVQRGSKAAHPTWTYILEQEIVEASRLGSFTADDVLDRLGRVDLPPNLIGAVLGSWRRTGRLRVVGREPARHREAKGRWVNRFEMTPKDSP